MKLRQSAIITYRLSFLSSRKLPMREKPTRNVHNTKIKIVTKVTVVRASALEVIKSDSFLWSSWQTISNV